MKRLSRYRWNKRKQEVLVRDGFKCTKCGAHRLQAILDIHHVVRRSKGGSDMATNLTTLCRNCHYAEHPEKMPKWTPGLNKMREELLKEKSSGQ